MKIDIELAETSYNLGRLEQLARRTACDVATSPATDSQIWSHVDEAILDQVHVERSLRLLYASNSAGVTLLHITAECGRLKAMEELLKHHEILYNTEAKNHIGLTALQMAAIAGHYQIIQLLNEKVDPCASFAHGRDSRDSPPGILLRGHSSSSYTDLLNSPEHAQIRMNPKTILPSFMTWGSFRRYRNLPTYKPTVPTDFRKDVLKTPLHHAAENGHVEAVKALLDSLGADLTAKDSHGNTPLHLAILNRNTQNLNPPWWNQDHACDHLAVIQMFISSRRLNVNIESDGPTRDTPLHSSVRMQDPDVVELLCSHRRIVAIKKNGEFKTPLRLAWEQEGHSDDLENVKELLLRREDVQRSVEELRKEREVLQFGVQALLVGGALLASFAFSGVLDMPTQPPKEHFDALASEADAPAPNAQTLNDREMWYTRVIDIFRGSNNMGFFLSIITVMFAIQVPISRRHPMRPIYLEREVEHLRMWFVFISFCLTLSTTCAAMAFVSAGLAKVPVLESGWSRLLATWHKGEWMPPFESTMITTSLAGLSVLVIILVYNFCHDYHFIVRDHISRKYSYSSLIALFLSVFLFIMVLGVLASMTIGYGLL